MMKRCTCVSVCRWSVKGEALIVSVECEELDAIEHVNVTCRTKTGEQRTRTWAHPCFSEQFVNRFLTFLVFQA